MKPDEKPLPSSASAETRPSERTELRVWHSEQILGDAREVLIVHGSETYRLRRTRLGKLILQK